MRQFESLGDYINGAFVKRGGEPFASHNPARQGEVIFTAYEQQGSVDRAVSAARAALRDWRRGDAPLSPEGVKVALERRIQALRAVAALVPEHQQRIAEAICLEMGKPLAEAMVEAGSIKSKIEGVIAQLEYTLPAAPADLTQQMVHTACQAVRSRTMLSRPRPQSCRRRLQGRHCR